MTAVEAVVDWLAGHRSIEGVRRTEHGASGTSSARLDGRDVVIKAWPSSPERERVLDTGLAHAAIMAARGVPVPRLLERGSTPHHTYLVYELIDGSWPPIVTDEIADQLVGVVDRERDAAPAAAPGWARTVASMITDGEPSLDLHPARLRAHPVGRQILHRAGAALQACDPAQLRSTDVVHADFAPENVLVRDGRIVGVVDWEQSRAGDATFDLAGMIFDIELGAKAAPPVMARLRRMVDERARAEVLRLYLNVYAVRYASWALGTEMEHQVLTMIDSALDDRR